MSPARLTTDERDGEGRIIFLSLFLLQTANLFYPTALDGFLANRMTKILLIGRINVEAHTVPPISKYIRKI
jgi:hypothetical protein